MCGNIVPKGTPMLMNIYKAWPNSRYWTKDADCFKCVISNFEQSSPRIWNTYAAELLQDLEGPMDAGD